MKLVPFVLKNKEKGCELRAMDPPLQTVHAIAPPRGRVTKFSQ